jgi:glutamate dehydrogenase (NADP+)
VNLGILKFLGFEQVFKNSLTTLPMGGAKGGANFNPKGKSDREVMRFCQSFMTELWRHIGKDVDIPAGDIGVGAREVSYLFGQYKRLQNEFTGAITGKGLAFGGSLIRTEATGYGCVYFVCEMLARRGDGVRGKTCAVSGSGNVALYTAQKLIELGAVVVTLSDSSGFIYDPDGIDAEKLAYLINLKTVQRGRIGEYAEAFDCDFRAGQRPWVVPCDVAFPCATQNELNAEDAKQLLRNGLIAVGEGANMPSTLEAIGTFRSARILYGPGKAANAGGVAVSGLEQSQNAMRLSWSRDEVDQQLHEIMRKIHAQCVHWGSQSDDYVDYQRGANLAGFIKVADAMLAYGVV